MRSRPKRSRTSKIPAVVAIALAAWVTSARGAVAADDLPRLWQPTDAVTFLLTTPRINPAGGVESAAPWEGGLADGVTRALFGTYHIVFSSQDLPVCAFSPSCSRFSQRAISRCGFLEGALLSLDRPLRDHPLAAAFYPVDAGGKLLADDPARYCLTAPR